MSAPYLKLPGAPDRVTTLTLDEPLPFAKVDRRRRHGLTALPAGPWLRVERDDWYTGANGERVKFTVTTFEHIDGTGDCICEIVKSNLNFHNLQAALRETDRPLTDGEMLYMRGVTRRDAAEAALVMLCGEPLNATLLDSALTHALARGDL